MSDAHAWQSLGVFLLETLAVLGVIALAAWGAVRVGRSRFGIGTKSGRLRIVERVALEPRRALYLVELDGETLLLSSAEGSVQLVKNLGASDVESPGRNGGS